jgi:glycosyltransferase involved in cell wall biosynthesis
MHILFLSQVLPYPLDAGPKMRSYYVLRHLAQQHQVTLLTFVRDTDRAEHVAHLAEFCEAVHTIPMQRSRWRDLKFLARSLLSGQPFIIIRDQLPAMTAQLRQLIESRTFDVIHADQLWMAQYAVAARRMAAVAPPKLILDQHNAVHLIPKRLAEAEQNPLKRFVLTREARMMADYEVKICQQFDQVVWVTAEDHRVVGALSEVIASQPAYSTIIPICADPDGIELVTPIGAPWRITFLGGLHWPPNAQGILWFAREVLPQIRASLPDAQLTVIGKDPPAGLAGEGIEVTGYVTEAELQSYLRETAVFIVPLHAGGGMRVKILDAWSWGLPIVSTTIGAEGIEVQPEHDILIADTPAAYADAVVRLLKDPVLASRLGQNGRKTVLQKYNWQTIYPAWDEVYDRLFEPIVTPV